MKVESEPYSRQDVLRRVLFHPKNISGIYTSLLGPNELLKTGVTGTSFRPKYSEASELKLIFCHCHGKYNVSNFE